MNSKGNTPCNNPMTCDSFKKTMVDILGEISIPSETVLSHSQITTRIADSDKTVTSTHHTTGRQIETSKDK